MIIKYEICYSRFYFCEGQETRNRAAWQKESLPHNQSRPKQPKLRI